MGFDETTICWRCEHGHETYEYEVDPRQRGTMLTYDRARLRAEGPQGVMVGRTDAVLVPVVVDPRRETNPN